MTLVNTIPSKEKIFEMADVMEFADILNDIKEIRDVITTMTNKRTMLQKMRDGKPAESDSGVHFSIGVSINQTSLYLSNVPTDVYLTPDQLWKTIALLITILDENIERQEHLLTQKVLSFRNCFELKP